MRSTIRIAAACAWSSSETTITWDIRRVRLSFSWVLALAEIIRCNPRRNQHICRHGNVVMKMRNGKEPCSPPRPDGAGSHGLSLARRNFDTGQVVGDLCVPSDTAFALLADDPPDPLDGISIRLLMLCGALQDVRHRNYDFGLSGSHSSSDPYPLQRGQRKRSMPIWHAGHSTFPTGIVDSDVGQTRQTMHSPYNVVAPHARHMPAGIIAVRGLRTPRSLAEQSRVHAMPDVPTDAHQNLYRRAPRASTCSSD
jgi:hypothetical protein